jgi:hypothetical protein
MTTTQLAHSVHTSKLGPETAWTCCKMPAFVVPWVICCFGFICLFLTGCSETQPTRVPVSGTVLIDGKPLTFGKIRFVPENGRPSSSAVLSDGTFDLASTTLSDRPVQAGVLPGKYRIEVSAIEVINEDTIRRHTPKKYTSFRSSGLNATIEEATTDLVIELTWDGVEGPVTEGPSEKDIAAELAREQGTQPEETSAASSVDKASE